LPDYSLRELLLKTKKLLFSATNKNQKTKTIMRVINLAEKEESTGKCRVGRGYEFAQNSLTSNC
jgi:hypothetical protein